MSDTFVKKEPVEYTTSTGITIKIKGIPTMLLDRIQSSVEMPKPPQYEIETASGDILYEYHTEDTLQTDEDKKLYAEYIKKLKEANDLLNERMFKVIAMRGIGIDMPKDDGWIEEQKFLGVEIPEDPLELKYLYIETEVIGNADDIMIITDLVMQATGVPEKDLEEARKSFPGGVQKVPATTRNARSRKRKVDK